MSDDNAAVTEDDEDAEQPAEPQPLYEEVTADDFASVDLNALTGSMYVGLYGDPIEAWNKEIMERAKWLSSLRHKNGRWRSHSTRPRPRKSGASCLPALSGLSRT